MRKDHRLAKELFEAHAPEDAQITCHRTGGATITLVSHDDPAGAVMWLQGRENELAVSTIIEREDGTIEVFMQLTEAGRLDKYIEEYAAQIVADVTKAFEVDGDTYVEGADGAIYLETCTIEDVVTLLKVHPMYARRLARSGKLTASKDSGKWLIATESVYAYRYDIMRKVLAKHYGNDDNVERYIESGPHLTWENEQELINNFEAWVAETGS